MCFVGLNLVNFGPLTEGRHLEFVKNKKFFRRLFWGSISIPIQFLSKSDEMDPFAMPKSDFPSHHPPPHNPPL